MRLWTLHLGEQLPTDEKPRLFRYGLLARAAASRGHQVVQWAPTFSHLERARRTQEPSVTRVTDGWEVRTFEAGTYDRNVSLARFRFHARAARAFREISHDLARDLERPDIILCALPTPGMAVAALDIARSMPGVRFVLDIRDLWPDVYLTMLPVRFRAGLRPLLHLFAWENRKAIRNADAVVAVSQDYLDWAHGFAPRRARGRDKVFPIGYPASRAGNSLPRDVHILDAELGDEDCLNLVFIGQLNRSCDLLPVFAAFRALQEHNATNTRLWVCGTGDREAEFRSAASDLDQVKFLGWLDSDQLAHVMRRCDAGLLAYAEGALQSLPNKPFEYMSQGLCLISNLEGELADLIHQSGCGLTYAMGDSAGLAEALRDLARQPDRLGLMRTASRELFEKSFEADQIYNEMVTYLESLASAGPAQLP